MLSSMTAFARVEESNLTWEIRSVNHRNLEVSFRFPDGYSELEPECRDLLKGELTRGKVSCALTIFQDPTATVRSINVDLLDSLSDELMFIKQRVSGTTDVSPLEILKWSGILDQDKDSEKIPSTSILSLFSRAVDMLNVARRREGRGIENIFEERLSTIHQLLFEIRQHTPNQSKYVQSRLAARLQRLQSNVDETRLATEVAILAQRADVDEELDRLELHLGEFRQTLSAPAAQGRRLGFLIQEIGREANTLATKMPQHDSRLESVC